MNEWFLKLKEKLSNMDANSALATLISTVGAMSTTDMIQIVYVCAAVSAQIFSMRLSYKKDLIIRDGMKEDLLLKQLDVKFKEEELRFTISKHDKEIENGTL